LYPLHRREREAVGSFRRVVNDFLEKRVESKNGQYFGMRFPTALGEVATLGTEVVLLQVR
jgi:hypothetical protein